MSLDLFTEIHICLIFSVYMILIVKKLENAILAELEKFILKMGSDFAFLARQKHFVLMARTTIWIYYSIIEA